MLLRRQAIALKGIDSLVIGRIIPRVSPPQVHVIRAPLAQLDRATAF